MTKMAVPGRNNQQSGSISTPSHTSAVEEPCSPDP